jgi:hypothetical protein
MDFDRENGKALDRQAVTQASIDAVVVKAEEEREAAAAAWKTAAAAVRRMAAAAKRQAEARRPRRRSTGSSASTRADAQVLHVDLRLCAALWPGRYSL